MVFLLGIMLDWRLTLYLKVDPLAPFFFNLHHYKDAAQRDSLTDALHDIGGFHTDYEFITKQQMKTIQKMSKGRK